MAWCFEKKNADLLKASSCQKHCLNATDKSTTLTWPLFLFSSLTLSDVSLSERISRKYRVIVLICGTVEQSLHDVLHRCSAMARIIYRERCMQKWLMLYRQKTLCLVGFNKHPLMSHGGKWYLFTAKCTWHSPSFGSLTVLTYSHAGSTQDRLNSKWEAKLLPARSHAIKCVQGRNKICSWKKENALLCFSTI